MRNFRQIHPYPGQNFLPEGFYDNRLVWDKESPKVNPVPFITAFIRREVAAILYANINAETGDIEHLRLPPYLDVPETNILSYIIPSSFIIKYNQKIESILYGIRSANMGLFYEGGFFPAIWTDRTAISTTFADRAAITTSFASRTKPTTVWQKRKQPDDPDDT